MTADQAADILDVTENTVRGYAREGLIRRTYVRLGAYGYRGVDVQRLRRLREKYGVREGMRRARLDYARRIVA